MTDLQEVHALLDRYVTAIRDKDARAVIMCYSRDAVAYDLAPPLVIGPKSLRDPAGIITWFEGWDGPIESAAQDLTVRCGGDVGYAFGLRHMTGTKTSGNSVDLWFRATATFAREDGAWKIVHVHNSVPFAMDGSDRALVTLKP